MPKRLVCLFALASVLAVSGCEALPFRGSISQRPESRKEAARAQVDDDVDTSWRFVGEAARGHQPMEIDRDPLRNLFTSKQRREIERNLGISGK